LASSPGRSRIAPEALSVKMRSFATPSFWRASSCRLRSRPPVLTRAYPTRRESSGEMNIVIPLGANQGCFSECWTFQRSRKFPSSPAGRNHRGHKSVDNYNSEKRVEITREREHGYSSESRWKPFCQNAVWLPVLSIGLHQGKMNPARPKFVVAEDVPRAVPLQPRTPAGSWGRAPNWLTIHCGHGEVESEAC
jgi:hypothetical protein